MKQKLLKLVSALLLGGLFTTANAQKTMDVSGFTREDADMMARITKPVHDKDEGKLCALIRVETGLKNLNVRADALGIVQQEEHNGEVWLYVPYGAKSLSFSHEGYFSLLYQYEMPIEEGVVYKLRLQSYDTPPTQGVATQTQMFVLSHNPDEATVIIDDMEVPTENGVFAAMMSKGEHSYKVKAPQYEEKEGEFVLGDQPVRETVKLQPLFGTFQLRTLPVDGFNVSINGQLVGTTPFKSERLDPGSYRIHIEKKDFVEKDTIIRLREGDNLEVTLESEEWYVYNNLLGGRDISFGISAGYVIPFASSSSGGSFTGSPINYSLGDSRENVNYTSQSGFTVGLMADFRLYKNFYLTTGINFSQVKYKNIFKESIQNIISSTTTEYANVGNMTNKYDENYTIRLIEIPILASYRFVLSKTSSLHLNLGPYFSYGLSAKLDFSGSSETTGNKYPRIGNYIDYTTSKGLFSDVSHINSEFDLYDKSFSFTKTIETGGDLGHDRKESYNRDDSPYGRFNYGLKMGLIYELKGFQIGLGYSLQLSNMANKDFWESARIPVFNGQVGENNMSGYRHKIHSLEIKLGYIFRY